jgi:hypothetical protein
MFNAQVTQRQVTALLKEMGQQMTLVKAAGGKYKTYGVWSKTESTDASQLSPTLLENKVVYLSGAVTKAPESGDTLEFGKRNWAILKVDAYQPAAVVIAYKVTMMN